MGFSEPVSLSDLHAGDVHQASFITLPMRSERAVFKTAALVFTDKRAASRKYWIRSALAPLGCGVLENLARLEVVFGYCLGRGPLGWVTAAGDAATVAEL